MIIRYQQLSNLIGLLAICESVAQLSQRLSYVEASLPRKLNSETAAVFLQLRDIHAYSQLSSCVSFRFGTVRVETLRMYELSTNEASGGAIFCRSQLRSENVVHTEKKLRSLREDYSSTESWYVQGAPIRWRF